MHHCQFNSLTAAANQFFWMLNTNLCTPLCKSSMFDCGYEAWHCNAAPTPSVPIHVCATAGFSSEDVCHCGATNSLTPMQWLTQQSSLVSMYYHKTLVCCIHQEVARMLVTLSFSLYSRLVPTFLNDPHIIYKTDIKIYTNDNTCIITRKLSYIPLHK